MYIEHKSKTPRLTPVGDILPGTVIRLTGAADRPKCYIVTDEYTSTYVDCVALTDGKVLNMAISDEVIVQTVTLTVHGDTAT